jgi:uncharacterized membrane protein HdeD (DUF308 family)
MFLGFLLILAGVGAMARPAYTGMALAVLAGIAILVAGIGHITTSFMAARPLGFFGLFGVGVLLVIGGVAMMMNPMEGLQGLTVVAGILLIVAGFMRLRIGSALRGVPGAGWIMFSGLVSLLLAILIFAKFPESSEIVLGIYIGVDLFMSGVTLTAAAATIRAAVKAAT